MKKAQIFNRICTLIFSLALLVNTFGELPIIGDKIYILFVLYVAIREIVTFTKYVYSRITRKTD